MGLLLNMTLWHFTHASRWAVIILESGYNILASNTCVILMTYKTSPILHLGGERPHRAWMTWAGKSPKHLQHWAGRRSPPREDIRSGERWGQADGRKSEADVKSSVPESRNPFRMSTSELGHHGIRFPDWLGNTETLRALHSVCKTEGWNQHLSWYFTTNLVELTWRPLEFTEALVSETLFFSVYKCFKAV